MVGPAALDGHRELQPPSQFRESGALDASLATGLTAKQRSAWERDGYFIVEQFADREQLREMDARIVELVRRDAVGESIAPAFVTTEEKIAQRADHPEDALSKLFRVHREETVFREFVCREDLLALAAGLLGGDLDCFLSQYIAKRPGALGQPWHQDAFYFPFDRGPQLGIWLAITEAHERNGPLWVLPGSHRDPVHPVVPDARPFANYGYVEIVGRDTDAAIPVLMRPVDMLFFHSHLMHRSTDNESKQSRMAMVYHLADAATVDQSHEKWGFTPPNVDWMPVLRQGKPVKGKESRSTGGGDGV
jgi:phytanoyl-CoA hydroxylase